MTLAVVVEVRVGYQQVDYGYILKFKSLGFPTRLTSGCERIEELRMAPRFVNKHLKVWRHHLLG